jgi:hypothetical protein
METLGLLLLYFKEEVNMSDYSKFETVAKIQEILEESGLYWSCSYSPSNDSYSIFICDEDGEIISRGLNNE